MATACPKCASLTHPVEDPTRPRFALRKRACPRHGIIGAPPRDN